MPTLLIELITLILARLPVKTLLQFKSVSKEWNSLISANHFANLHRHHCPPGGHIEDHHIISIHRKYNKFRNTTYIERWDLHSCPSHTGELVLPSLSVITVVSVLCSCYGLVILKCRLLNHNNRSLASELIMWNPSINDYVVLPFPGSSNSRYGCFGLGYDESNNDYKLVCFARIDMDIGNFRPDDHTYSRQVYSSKHNCWGEPHIEDNIRHVYRCFSSGNAVIDNHIIHWFCKKRYLQKDGDCCLRGFDVCLEEWIDVPLPDLPEQGRFKVQSLGVLDDCLCVVSHSYKSNMTQVWVMEAYGVKESWINLFTLTDFTMLGEKNQGLLHTNGLVDYSPLAYSKGGDKVLIRVMGGFPAKNKLIWYDLKGKTWRWNYVDRCNSTGVDIIHCVASLVPVSRKLGEDNREI